MCTYNVQEATTAIGHYQLTVCQNDYEIAPSYLEVLLPSYEQWYLSSCVVQIFGPKSYLYVPKLIVGALNNFNS